MGSKIVFKQENVRPVEHRAYCPNCGDELKTRGGITNLCGTSWEYECFSCDQRFYSPEQCPRIEYVKDEFNYIRDESDG